MIHDEYISDFLSSIKRMSKYLLIAIDTKEVLFLELVCSIHFLRSMDLCFSKNSLMISSDLISYWTSPLLVCSNLLIIFYKSLEG